jgi:transposase
MARDPSELTAAPWEQIAPLLLELQASPGGGPTPMPHRPGFEGLLGILRTGARWPELPEQCPSPSTCGRRLRDWEAQGVWRKGWRAFFAQLEAHGRLDWAETLADGSFAPANTGGPASGRPHVARGRRGWWWSTATVFLGETSWTRRPRRKEPSWTRPWPLVPARATAPVGRASSLRVCSTTRPVTRTHCGSAWPSGASR